MNDTVISGRNQAFHAPEGRKGTGRVVDVDERLGASWEEVKVGDEVKCSKDSKNGKLDPVGCCFPKFTYPARATSESTTLDTQYSTSCLSSQYGVFHRILHFSRDPFRQTS